MARNVGFAQVTVSPVFTGFQTAVKREVNNVFPSAGRQAGQALGKGAADGFKSESATLKAEADRAFGAVVKAQDHLNRVKREARAANDAEAKALGDLRVAEQRLEEVRNNSRATASQVAAAEEKVEDARRKVAARSEDARDANARLETASRELKAAEDAAEKATRELADAQDRLADEAGKAERKVEDVGNEARETGRKFDGLKSVAKTAFAAIAASIAAVSLKDLLADTVELASNLEQARGAAEQIFGSSSGQAQQFAASAAERLGLSEGEYLTQAGLLGAQGKNLLGIAEEDLAAWVDEQIAWAADLAAMFGGTTSEALEAIMSMNRGEYNPIERYGVSVNARLADAYAKEHGLTRAEAQLEIAKSQTSDAEGTFAREADTFAGQQQRLTASVENFKTEIGEALLPVAQRVVTFLRESVLPVLRNLKDWFEENSDKVRAFGIAVGAAFAVFAAGSLVAAAPAMLQAVATGIRAINTAIKSNIIVLILTAIAGVIAYLWTTNEGFRDFVLDAWEKIKNAISVAWEAIRPAFEAFTAWIRDTLIPALTDFYENTVKPAWEGIRSAIATAWENVIRPAFEAIQNFIRNVLAPAFQWFYRNVIEPVWKSIRFAIEGAWNIIKLIFDAVKWYLNNVLGPVFTWLRDKVIAPVWNGIRDTISNVWNNRIKPVLDAVGKFIRNTVAPGFEKGVNRIRDIWNGLRSVAAKPINFVIETVYNNGIKKVFDSVAQAIGSDARLPRATPIPAYAKGGLAAPGWALVGEEGPELVNFDRPGRVYTAKETAEVLDRMAGSRPSEALLPMGGSVWDNIGSWVSNTWRSAVDWVKGSLASAANAILDPIRTAIRNNVPDVGLGTVVRGAAMKAIDNVIAWVRGKDDEALADGSAEYTGRVSGWRRPSLGRITSLFGPRWGSFHYGVDFAGAPGRRVLAAADGLVRHVGGYGTAGISVLVSHGNGLESLYGHAPSLSAVRVRPGDTVKAGQWISQEGATGRATGPHLHFSIFRNGKALNPMSFIGGGGGGSSSAPRVYDNGGWLTPGVQTVANFTRKPEAVLTAGQWAAVRSLAASAVTGGDVYQIDRVDLSTDTIRSLEDFAHSLRRHVRQK